MAQAPTTPARLSGSGANLDSLRTPSNVAGAAVSDQLNSFLVEEGGPWIAYDIKSNSHCDFERFLRVLLLRATKGNVNKLPDLQPYLNAVLPLCDKLVPDLRAYCKAARNGKEPAMYPPLVSLLSTAMGGLKGVDVEGLLGDDEELLFHISDPTVIKTVHRGGVVSERKPNIILLSCETARNAGNPEAISDHWSGVGLKSALKPPMRAFTWEESRVPVEVKPGSISSKTPASYVPPPLRHNRRRIRNRRRLRQSQSRYPASVKRGRPQRSKRLSPRATQPKAPPTKRTAAPNQTIQHQDKLHVTIQCALYGAEMLSASPSLASAMSLAIIGNIVHVWWYDRQWAIQTKGLDFVEDLPYFVVLLLALQRLGPVGYGELPFKKGKKIIIPSGPVEITLGEAIVKHYGIVGRATNIYHAKSSAPDPWQVGGGGTFALVPCCTMIKAILRTIASIYSEPSIDQISISIDGIRNLTLDGRDYQGETADSLEGLEMVAKISWVREHRTAEHIIVNNAVKKAKELPDEDDDRIAIIGHVPEIIAAIEYDRYGTKLIREQLGFDPDHTAVKRNRGCRVIISRRLRPLPSLRETIS
ncbi:hypothetical protein FRB94_009918 [Tulasnella sp. JGI-2019a]|nr:hypothetical protein FRB94_009918 [Tulasnella sp. JGI-2019a]